MQKRAMATPSLQKAQSLKKAQSLQKAWLIWFFLLFQMLAPAGAFRWWMVRQFNQKYYFIHENGYYVEMDPDHVESLEEAFTYHPEMATLSSPPSYHSYNFSYSTY